MTLLENILLGCGLLFVAALIFSVMKQLYAWIDLLFPNSTNIKTVLVEPKDTEIYKILNESNYAEYRRSGYVPRTGSDKDYIICYNKSQISELMYEKTTEKFYLLTLSSNYLKDMRFNIEDKIFDKNVVHPCVIPQSNLDIIPRDAVTCVREIAKA